MKRAAVWLVALLAGCSIGAGEKRIDEDELDRLVLQPADVSPGLHAAYIRNLSGLPVSHVRYRRARSRKTDLHTIESKVQAFDSSDTADQHLEAEQDALDQRPNWDPIDEPGLGDESFAATLVQNGVRYYDVFWRDANVTAWLRGDGFDGSLPLADVLELARKQDRRIANAADDG